MLLKVKNKVKINPLNECPLSPHLDYLSRNTCKGIFFFFRRVNRKKKTDWGAESEAVCIFHHLQLPLAAGPALLKFRGIMEMAKLVKGSLGERSYKLHKTHES